MTCDSTCNSALFRRSQRHNLHHQICHSVLHTRHGHCHRLLDIHGLALALRFALLEPVDKDTPNRHRIGGNLGKFTELVVSWGDVPKDLDQDGWLVREIWYEITDALVLTSQSSRGRATPHAVHFLQSPRHVSQARHSLH